MKPCPFCGSASVHRDTRYAFQLRFRFYCADCGAMSGPASKEDEARELWDTRTEEPAPAAGGRNR